MADIRHAQGTLNVGFKYSGSIEHGDHVEIGANRTVGRIGGIGSLRRLGIVATMDAALSMCTVETSFRGHRKDLIAGEHVVPGPFVIGPGNKVWQYTPALPARAMGTTTGPVEIESGVSDTVKVTLEGAEAQTIVISGDDDRSFDDIAAELNETLVGMTAFVDTSDHMGLMSRFIGKSITIGEVTHDAYTQLGWTPGTYSSTNSSHDPAAQIGVIIVGGSKGDTVETLEW